MEAIRRRLYERAKSVLFWFELVDLLYVNCKTTSCVKTARAHATFEMFGLLMLH
jgi:hypothetical protein